MNKLLSQNTFTSNKKKEKISYLNYLPPTIDESSSDMSCKFIFLFNVCTCENFV